MMGYKYKRRRRSNGFGSAVSDTVGIANSFGAKGAAIAGGIGFLFFYFLLPALLTGWIDYNKKKMIGSSAAMFTKMLDEIAFQRFIRPSEWAGIAILVICSAISAWKLLFATNLTHSQEKNVTWIGKVIARWLD